ncbi:23976_t:CDS:1, partial [Racocetra persica]
SRHVVKQQRNPFNHSSNKDGGILEFTYTASNDNLVTGETFER